MARIEMGDGHGGRSYGSFAVHLGIVTGSNRRIVAAKPDSAYRKPRIAPPLGNTRFLQQGQRSAASTDENEFGFDITMLAALLVPYPYTPKLPVTAQVLHAAEKANGESLLALEGIEKVCGEGAIIHVGAGRHMRCRHFLARVAAFHDKRNPFLDLLFVIGIFHAVITGIGRERLEALFEKRDVIRSAHKTHMRDRMNKRLRVLDRSFFHQVSPELTGKIELRVDLQRLGNVDAAVTFLRRVVQLAERRMAGAGIVPRIRAFLCLAAQHFVDFYLQAGIKFLQDHGQGGAHDASADKNDIGMIGCCHGMGPVGYWAVAT